MKELMKQENNTAQEKLVFIQLKNQTFAGLTYQRKITTLYFYQTRIDFGSCIKIWCVYARIIIKNDKPNFFIHEKS